MEEVASATREAMAELATFDPADVHYVQVKGPLLTPAAIRDAATRGVAVVTTDPNASKTCARERNGARRRHRPGGSGPARVTDAVIGRDPELFSSVASTSAGGELVACEVILFANSPLPPGASASVTAFCATRSTLRA